MQGLRNRLTGRRLTWTGAVFAAWLAVSTTWAQSVRLSPPRFPGEAGYSEPSTAVAYTVDRRAAASGPTADGGHAMADVAAERELPEPPITFDRSKFASTPATSPGSLSDSVTIASPWWHDQVARALHSPQLHLGVSLESLLIGALQHSAQVRIISEQPLIREMAIVEAQAAFDWVRFLDSRWDDTSDPVSTTLQTGNTSRYRNNQWSLKGGVRRRNTLGGTLEASQQFGFQNTNSLFFVPNDQGTARLNLRYTQPLMRGRGAAYNRSLIVLAQLDATVAHDEFSRQLQAHLLDVTEAYWTLYLERAGMLQKQRLYDRAGEVLALLEQRRDIDALNSQILKARAAVATRRSELVRTLAAVQNTERRIRMLVNDPQLDTEQPPELVPIEHPPQTHLPLQPYEVFETAVQHRPEIDIAMQRVRSAGLRLQMAKNELLPELNMVLETYVAGLRGHSDFPTAAVEQFRTGEPGYSVGLQYEMPLHNRAARARHQQGRIELRQMRSEFELALQTIRYEVEIALRDLNTSYQEMFARYQAIEAADAEMRQLADRWRLLPGDDRSASLLLEDLLDSQQRVNDAEFAFLHAQLKYSLAQTTLKQSMGTLLEQENIRVDRVSTSDGPQLMPEKLTENLRTQ